MNTATMKRPSLYNEKGIRESARAALPPPVFFCSSINEAKHLMDFGLTSCAPQMGAEGHTSRLYALKDRKVHIIPAYTQAGIDAADALAVELAQQHGCTVSIFDVETAKGGAVEYLRRLKEEGNLSSDTIARALAIHLKPPTHSTVPEDGSAQVVEWEKPVLFDEADLPIIPANLLPPPFGEFAAALAASTETDEGQAVMAVLGALSTACGGKFEVVINAEHREPCHVYILTAIDSGNNKSAMVSACTGPLTEWERAEKERMEPDAFSEGNRHLIPTETGR